MPAIYRYVVYDTKYKKSNAFLFTSYKNAETHINISLLFWANQDITNPYMKVKVKKALNDKNSNRYNVRKVKLTYVD